MRRRRGVEPTKTQLTTTLSSKPTEISSAGVKTSPWNCLRVLKTARDAFFTCSFLSVFIFSSNLSHSRGVNLFSRSITDGGSTGSNDFSIISAKASI